MCAQIRDVEDIRVCLEEASSRLEMGIYGTPYIYNYTQTPCVFFCTALHYKNPYPRPVSYDLFIPHTLHTLHTHTPPHR